jgi:CheY-like chemotaxis protein
MSEGASSEVLTLPSALDLTAARALKETFAEAQLSRTDGVVEGLQGFASARRWRRSAATKVDLMITDVNMPNIDGITLSRNCKRASASCCSSAFLGILENSQAVSNIEATMEEPRRPWNCSRESPSAAWVRAGRTDRKSFYCGRRRDRECELQNQE